jgi:hypothetical protein
MTKKYLLKNRIYIFLFVFVFQFNSNAQVATLDINGNFVVDGYTGLYWEYKYRQNGSTNVLESTIQSRSAVTVRLNPFITWDFSTRSYDLLGKPGPWTKFTTINENYLSISKSVGYNFNFDSSAIVEGWRGYRIQNTTFNTYSNIGETEYFFNGSKGKSITMVWRTGYELMLVSPKISDLSTDKKFSFFVNSYQGNFPIVLGTITDPFDPSTFHPLKTLTLNEGKFEKIEAFLNNYNGQDQYIAIKNSGNSGEINIDDFSYEQSVNCFDNTNLIVSNINEDNAIVNFNADAAQNKWELYLKDVTHNIEQTLNINTNYNYLLENLAGNTTYEVKVRANCATGLYSNWTPIQTFTTPCTTISSGYKTSFLETTFFDPCWTKLESGAYIYQAPLTGISIVPRTGSRFIQMNNSSTANTQKSFIVTPYINDLDNSKRIKFFLISMTNGFDYNKSPLTIGTMSNPNDISTFVPLKTISPSEMNEINGYKTNDFWKEHIVYLDNYNNNLAHHYIAIKQENLDSNSIFNIDDFAYESTPTCKEPVNLKLIKSDFKSATVTWENNNNPSYGEWEIQYGISGFTLGTGITVSSTNIITTLTNLLGITNYDFYVRSKCENSYSDWSDRGTFKTKCTGLSTGYSYNFENDSFESNNCWSRTTPDIKDRSYKPSYFINYIKAPYGNLTNTHSGTKAIGLFNNHFSPDLLENEKTILVTPRLLDLNNERKISFWAYIPSIRYSKLTSIQIGTLSDPEDYTTFVPYESITTGFELDQWKNYTVDFSKYYDNNKYVGIRIFNDNRGSYAIYIDDFEYSNTNCSRPSNLIATQNETNSAVLSWKTNNNNPINCEIEYGPIGFTPGTGTVLNTNTLPLIITNLETNQKYQFRVRNICSSDIVNWSDLYNFKISCTVNTPFTENFDQYTVNEFVNGNSIPNFCWTINENENAYLGVSQYSLTNFNSSPNSGFLRNNNIEKPSYYISPFLIDFNSEKRIKFWLNMYDQNTTTNQDFTIGTLSNPLDLTTFTPYQILDTQDMPAYGREINIDFSNYSGTNKYIAFKLTGDNSSRTFFIDDIKYLNYNTCLEPINIRFLNISNNSLLAKWDNNNSENVAIEYGVSGFMQGTGTVVNNSNEILIKNLLPSTEYDFYLKTTCNSGQSITVGPKKITTTCDLKSLPWYENLRDLSQYGDYIVPNCFKSIIGSKFELKNKSEQSNGDYENDKLLSGYDDSTYFHFYDGFLSQIFTPLFNLTSGTTYKFSLQGRKSYEYRSMSIGVSVGRGHEVHYMESDLNIVGELSEYKYNKLDYYFTPLISGDYSYLLNIIDPGSINLIVDNFELAEAYKSVISNNNDLFDFQNGENNKLIVESTQTSFVTIESDLNDNTNKLLRMSGSEKSSLWKYNQTDMWESNQNSITKVNFKINAIAMSSLLMAFDLKQTFNDSSDESMFRVVINGNVVGDLIKPNSKNLDVMKTFQYDLTPFVGKFINISLQHLGKSSDNIGDNAYLDNLRFSQNPTLSVSENNFIGLNYYPNPVTNVLNIENNSLISNVDIISVTGQTIFKKDYNHNKISIDTKKLSNGIYFLEITSEDKIKVIKVLVSQ